MKKLLLTIFSLIIFISCSARSRETFELQYDKQRLVRALSQGALVSLTENGSFLQDNHEILEFKIDTMQLNVREVVNGVQSTGVDYGLEVVLDNGTEGIFRLFGAGTLNDIYIGVVTISNNIGVFAKIHMQNTQDNIVELARAKSYWEFVSDIIPYRANNLYDTQSIVNLTPEGFFTEQNHSYFVPQTATRMPDTTGFTFDHAEVVSSVSNDFPTITVLGTRLIAPNTEVLEVQIDADIRYMGFEFDVTPNRTEMKIQIANTFSDATNRLAGLTRANYDIIDNAQRPNFVIQEISDQPLVLLTKPPVTGEYFWENTDQLTFNAEDMTLNLISTRNPITLAPIGITNTSDYTIRMLNDGTTTSGIFSISGNGRFANLIGVLVIKKVGDITLANFSTQPTLNEARTELTRLLGLTADTEFDYQDLRSAIRPYRLVMNMDTVGNQWAGLIDNGEGAMTFDSRNTDIFEFLSIRDRTLRHISIVNGVQSQAHYKVVVAEDFNNTNGVLLLQGFTDDTFTTPDENLPLHGRFMAIDQGSELYRTQAKYAIEDTVSAAIQARDRTPLFNLHERRSLPSNFRVISAMQSFGDWVALLYPTSTGPGQVPVGIAADLEPFYSARNTFEFRFDITLSPFVEVTDFVNGVRGLTTTYAVDVINEISPNQAVFQLRRTRNGSNNPNLHTLYWAVRIGEGSEANQGYYAFGTTEEEAMNELTRIFDAGKFNYHAKDSAPVAATVINTVSGIRYILLNTDSSGVPNGTVTPFNTSYITFDFNTLTARVETQTPNISTPTAVTYNLVMRLDEGDFAGIFRLDGAALPFDGLFFRIDVQQGANRTQKIRLLSSTDTTALETGIVTPIANVNDFSVAETTHIDATSPDGRLPDTGVVAANVLNSRWASVDETDKMFSFFNNREIIFDVSVTPHTITINDTVNGALVNNDTYTYQVQENTVGAGSVFSVVLRLAGNGALRNQYLAFQNTTPTTPPNNGVILDPDRGIRFVFANTFNLAKAALVATPLADSFIIPDYPWTENLLNTFNTYIPNVPNGTGFGTPSFVRLVNGSFDALNTETWSFNSSRTNVQITHNNGVRGEYTVHMKATSDAVGSAGNQVRPSALFYLKSEDETAPYHNQYISIRQHQLIGNPATGTTESTFSVIVNPDRDVASDASTPVQFNMRDLRSATVPAQAFNLAASQVWTRVTATAPTTAPRATENYQLNRENTEVWEIRFNNTFRVRVTSTNGSTVRQDTYVASSRQDTSTHRGVFTLRADTSAGTPTSAPYHNTMVALALGGEPTASGAPAYVDGNTFNSESARIYVVNITGTLAAAEAEAIRGRDTLPEWNFRSGTQTSLPFNPLQAIDTVDNLNVGWVRLTFNATENEFEYNASSTERWIFRTITPNFENIVSTPQSSVYEIGISQNSSLPTDLQFYGAKLISTSLNGIEGRFQLFVNGGSLTNQFVVFTLGQGLNQKLLRLSVGNTLDDALQRFNDLGQNFNYATFDRATADVGVIAHLDAGFEWSLTRPSPTDTSILGSSLNPAGGGNLVVSATGEGRPSYDPANTINFTFDQSVGVMNVLNFVSVDRPTPFSYGLIPVENVSSTAGIYISSGFGPYQNRFVYIELAEEPVAGNENAGKRARLSVASTLNEVIANHARLVADNRWNFFNTDWLRTSAIVFEMAARQDMASSAAEGITGRAITELGFQEAGNINVYDATLARSYTIFPDPVTINGRDLPRRTVLISNTAPDNTRDDFYTYEMIRSETETGQARAYALLQGSGPDNGRYMGIRLSGDATPNVIGIYIADTATAIEAQMQFDVPTIDPSTPVGDTAFRYRTLASVLSRSGILTNPTFNLSVGGTKAILDQDGIYLAFESTQWTFNPDQLQATVVNPNDGSPITTVYKTVPVRVAGESQSNGVLFIKGTGPLNGSYVGINITRANSADFNIFTGATALADAIAAMAGTSDDNFVPLNTVNQEYPVLDILQQITGSVGFASQSFTLNTLTFNPENTFRYFLDQKNRTMLIIDNTTASRTTNYLRFRLNPPLRNISGRRVFGFVFVSNSRSDLNFQDNPNWEIVPTRTAAANSPVGAFGVSTASAFLGAFNAQAIGIAINSPDNPTGFFLGVSRSVPTSYGNLSRDVDTRLIPLSILQNDGEVMATLIGLQPAADDNNVYLPVDADGDLQTSATDIAFRPILQNAPAAGFPAVYRLRVYRPGANNTVTGAYNFQTKILENRGASDGTILPFALGRNIQADSATTPFNAQLSNKSVAIRVGTGINETRVRIAIGDTQSEAITALNALTFWNYRPTFVLEAQSNPLILRALAQTGGAVNTWSQASNTDITVNLPITSRPGFSPVTFTAWIFNADDSTANTFTVVNNVTNISSYQVEMIRNISDTEGIFQLTGFGSQQDQFAHARVIDSGNAVQIAFGDTIEAATAAFNAIPANNANFFEAETLLVPDTVFALANTRSQGSATANSTGNAWVQLGFEETGNLNIYDPTLVRSYTFFPNGTTIDGRVFPRRTVLISNVSPTSTRSDFYNYAVIENINEGRLAQGRTYALLQGTGPDGNRYIGVRLPNSLAGSNMASIFIEDTDVAIRTAISWESNAIPAAATESAFRFRTLGAVESKTGILNNTALNLSTGGTKAILDQDGIYLAFESTQWTFNPDQLQATVVNPNDGSPITTAYKTLPVKVAGETASRGVLYIKGSGVLNGSYVGINITRANSADFNIFTGATALADATAAMAGSGADNFVTLNTVNQEYPVLDILQQVGGSSGLSTLLFSSADYRFNPNNTFNYILDARNRMVLVVENTSIRSTNYFRFRLAPPLATVNNRDGFTITYVSNTRTDLNFQGNSRWTTVVSGSGVATDSPVGAFTSSTSSSLLNASSGTTGNSFGISSGIEAEDVSAVFFGNGLTTATANMQRLGADPKVVPLPILRNSPQVLDTLVAQQPAADDNNVYLPVDSENNLLIGANDIAFRPILESAAANGFPNTYCLRVYRTRAGNIVSSPFTYLTKVARDGGRNDGIILPYAGGRAIDAASATTPFNTQLSNRAIAIRVGSGTDETKVRVAIADTANEATVALNALAFWNYRPTFVLNAQDNPLIFNALYTNSRGIQNTWIQADRNSAAGHLPVASPPRISPQTFTAWVFNAVDQTATTFNVVNNVTNTRTYQLDMVRTISATEGIYQLVGIGQFADNFFHVQINTGGTSARWGFGTTIAASTQAFNAVPAANANIFEAETLLVPGTVFALANTRSQGSATVNSTGNAWVQLGFEETGNLNIYDSTLVRSFTFLPNGGTIDGRVFPSRTVLISNVSPTSTRNDIYTYVVVSNLNEGRRNQGRSYAVLQGTGPDGGRYIGIRLPNSLAGSNMASIFIANTDVAIRTALTWDSNTIPAAAVETAFRFRTLGAVESKTGILNTSGRNLSTGGVQAILDQDGIYLAFEGLQWTFNPADLSATVVNPNDGGSTTSFVYKTIPIKTVGETATLGVLYIKGTGPLNGAYIGVDLTTATSAKFYIFNTGNINNDFANARRIFTSALPANMVALSTVNDPYPALDLLDQISGTDGITTLNFLARNFTFSPANTHTYYVDASNRVMLVVDNTPTSRTTNYLRIRLSAPEPDGTAGRRRFSYQFVSNSRTDLFFRGNRNWRIVPTRAAAANSPVGAFRASGQPFFHNWFIAIGIPNIQARDVTGMYYGIDPNNIFTARNNRNNGLDPKLTSVRQLRNPPEALATIRDFLANTPLLPVNSTGNVQSGANDISYFPVFTTAATAGFPDVYRLRVARPQNNLTTTSQFNYLVNILQNGGPNSIVISPFAAGDDIQGGSRTSPYNAQLSNRAVAIRVGTGADERRVRIAIGNNLDDALNNVNALPFFNYLPTYTLQARANTTFLDQLGTAPLVPLANINAGAPVISTPGFNNRNHRVWTFNNSARTATTLNIVSGVTNTEGLYRVVPIQVIGQVTIFQLIGFGPFADRFVQAGRFSRGRAFRLGFGNSITEARNHYNSLGNNVNFFNRNIFPR